MRRGAGSGMARLWREAVDLHSGVPARREAAGRIGAAPNDPTEPRVQTVTLAELETAQMRHAGKELLSLALIDSRNTSLRWAAAFEAAYRHAEPAAHTSGLLPSPRWLFGHMGWFQERWIGRNVERQRGTQADATRAMLASILPEADAWFDTALALPAEADWQTLRDYLVASLETTLELLANAEEDDDALYFYRLALFNEDAAAEHFAVIAQTLGVAPAWLVPMPARAVRPPLVFPATRWPLGSAAGGFVFDAEQPVHEVPLPEFEIDSQAVNWAQYGEFAEDGGYDDRRLWSADGWAWIQAHGRRTPRHVEQMRHGVLQRRFGHAVRVPATQAAVHVSWYEADAWCRWAGRRLPHEAEWEAAAVLGATRGFRWGDVQEWTAGTLRPYPGAVVATPGQAVGRANERVLRGASAATAGRLRHPKARHGRREAFDLGFCGFRSCAV